METSGKLESALNAVSSNLAIAEEQSGSRLNTPKEPLSGKEMWAVERMASSAHQAVDKISHAAIQAAQAFNEKSRQIKDTQLQVKDNVRQYVTEHPAASIGIALAAGFLIRHFLRLR